MELSPDAKLFVDYDGRLGSRLQEHSISGGLKVRFWRMGERRFGSGD